MQIQINNGLPGCGCGGCFSTLVAFGMIFLMMVGCGALLR